MLRTCDFCIAGPRRGTTAVTSRGRHAHAGQKKRAPEVPTPAVLRERPQSSLPLSSGLLQTKLDADVVSPPMYSATCGYGQSGRVNVVTPFATCAAGMLAGAVPCSTHCSSAVTASNVV